MAGKTESRGMVVAAIIGAVGVVGAAAVSVFFPSVTQKLFKSSRQVTVRVADSQSTSIPRAKTTLFFDGGQQIKYTDDNGVSSFSLDYSQDIPARLIVETGQYGIYEQEVLLPRDKNIDVRLKTASDGQGTYVVRLVDGQTQVPADGADVKLLVAGKTYQQSTDVNGIAKFAIPSKQSEITAQLAVASQGQKYTFQNLTLANNKLSDVDLAQPEVTKNVSNDTEAVGDGKLIAFGQTLTGSIDTPAKIEKYKFSANNGAKVLVKVSRSSGSFWPRIRIYGPEGNSVGETFGTTSAELEKPLTTDGTYVIMVDNYLGGTETGDYYINLQKAL